MMNDNQTSSIESLAAQVAGSFYSDDSFELQVGVDDYLERSRQQTILGSNAPKVIIAPHAGHMFSGFMAATAYNHLRPARGSIKRVVLVGPAHRYSFRGVATTSANTFKTPLGSIPVDQNMVSSLVVLKRVEKLDAAFQGEHCLEVHLPFLQRLLNSDFSIVPLIVGTTNPEVVAEILEQVWGGDETIIVISSDLSHFHTYEQAQTLDWNTQKAIELLDAGSLNGEAACGYLPITGVLQIAKRKGMRVTTLGRCSSGDTGGGLDRVVGYGAWRIDLPEKAKTPEAIRRDLIALAARAIRHYGENREVLNGTAVFEDFQYLTQRATFITLTLNGQLRGCIGTLKAHRALCDDVINNAVAAAFQDPRFCPLSSDEFSRLEIAVSILSQPAPLVFESEEDLLAQLVPGEDGLVLRDQAVSPPAAGTFLPAVWASLPEPEEFLMALKQKAGLPKGYWSQTLIIERYRAEKFSGPVPTSQAEGADW